MAGLHVVIPIPDDQYQERFEELADTAKDLGYTIPDHMKRQGDRFCKTVMIAKMLGDVANGTLKIVKAK